MLSSSSVYVSLWCGNSTKKKVHAFPPLFASGRSPPPPFSLILRAVWVRTNLCKYCIFFWNILCFTAREEGRRGPSWYLITAARKWFLGNEVRINCMHFHPSHMARTVTRNPRFIYRNILYKIRCCADTHPKKTHFFSSDSVLCALMHNCLPSIFSPCPYWEA